MMRMAPTVNNATEELLSRSTGGRRRASRGRMLWMPLQALLCCCLVYGTHAMMVPFFRFSTRFSKHPKKVIVHSSVNRNATRIDATNTNSTESSSSHRPKFPSFLFPAASRRRKEEQDIKRRTTRSAPLFSTISVAAPVSPEYDTISEAVSSVSTATFAATTGTGTGEVSPDGVTATRSNDAKPEKEESVHLKLGSQAMMQRVEEGDDNEENIKNPKNNKRQPRTTAKLHSYVDPSTNQVLYKGLNMHKRKFCAWVNYTLNGGLVDENDCVLTEEVKLDDESMRAELRQLWKERRLLSERTEILAVYQSDSDDGKKKKNGKKKRGGFNDLLHLYAQRLAAIIQDELEEEKISRGELRVYNDTVHGEQLAVPRDLIRVLNGGLLGWLQREYGSKETKRLSAETFGTLSESEQVETLQHFMDWFRSRFPYYYDRCDSCGASAKDDNTAAVEEEEDENNSEDQVAVADMENTIDDGNASEDTSEQDDHDDGSSFLGYVYPTREELVGKASRTEIYQCSKCGAFTRFPRYNSASSIILNKRGRCGEYSMLLFRFLRAAGHEARWIVDWADHVWAEVRLNGRWIHLDPCEAAVDKPLLYQEWGKQQTYIVAFRAPSSSSSTSAAQQQPLPLIEDVTSQYTSQSLDEIQKRREESTSDIDGSVGKIAYDLEVLLNDILH